MSLSVLVFSDAERTSDYGQLSYFGSLLAGLFAEGSLFFTLSRMSQHSRGPVKSIGAAEILAAEEAIDEGIVLTSALSILLGTPLRLVVASDSFDLLLSFHHFLRSASPLISLSVPR